MDPTEIQSTPPKRTFHTFHWWICHFSSIIRSQVIKNLSFSRFYKILPIFSCIFEFFFKTILPTEKVFCGLGEEVPPSPLGYVPARRRLEARRPSSPLGGGLLKTALFSTSHSSITSCGKHLDQGGFEYESPSPVCRPWGDLHFESPSPLN